MPREVEESRAEIWGGGQVEAKTGEVDAGVREEEEDGTKLSDLVEAADQETQLHPAEGRKDSTEKNQSVLC